jgi:RimJ/RimL family protein N-acetyltransferase
VSNSASEDHRNPDERKADREDHAVTGGHQPTGVYLNLVPFTAQQLPLVQPWFLHPEVRRWLGGPEWPARELRLTTVMPAEQFRGRLVLRTHSWIALDPTGTPLAKIGGDVYDQWTRYDGSQPTQAVITSAEPGPAMGLAYVVDPQRWRKGVGRAVIRAAVDHPDVADVRIFAAGIDTSNEPGRRCAAAAGFYPDTDQPDWEDTIYYLLRREPQK